MSRQVLPVNVIEALDECIKTAEKYGRSHAVQSPLADSKRTLMNEAREKALEVIRAHASTMYEGGIELGIAQAESGGLP